jgi:hypothetical protein
MARPHAELGKGHGGVHDEEDARAGWEIQAAEQHAV